MPGGNGSQQTTAFTSWKEIAAYLGKGVRTVQRWECRFGLPVRRPNQSSRSVYITRQDLDHWLATRWSHRLGIPASTTPGNGAKAGMPSDGGKGVCAAVNLDAYRESRDAQRRLLDEVNRALRKLEQNCQTLALSVNESRGLMNSTFPVSHWLNQRRQSPPRLATERPRWGKTAI
jgi:hypothetical protein